MLHKGLEQYLGQGLAENDCKRFMAFSLAEMLIVLLIMSFIALGLPAIHFKKTQVKTKRSVHGRYECFYNDAGQLSQYTVNEEGVETLEENITECSFDPPKNAIFFLVHAVGGGGGSSTATGSIGSVQNYSLSRNYTRGQVNELPQWMKDVQGANALPAGPWDVSVSGKSVDVRRGNPGNPGDTQSIFYPRLKDIQVIMKPGKGGARGAAGTKTEVYFSSGTTRNLVMEAAGGTGGTGSSTVQVLLDGPKAMCAAQNLYKEPDFATNVEMDEGTSMRSAMQDAFAGSGGSGSRGNLLSNSYIATYQVNGIDVSAQVKKPNCDDPAACDDGTTGLTLCPGQPGRNGAVVILW